MATGLSLLKEASYGFFPQLLARGNFRQPKSSGYFPVVVGDGAAQVGFTMYNMQAGDGYDPEKGCINFNGVDDYIQNATDLNFDPTEFTLFVSGELDGDSCLMSFGEVFPNTVHIGASTSNLIGWRVGAKTDDSDNFEYYYSPGSNSIAVTISNNEVGYNNGTAVGGPYSLHTGYPNSFTSLALGRRYVTGNFYLNGKIHVAIVFPRALAQEEVEWLDEQSLLGFPGIKADAYGPNNEFARISRTRRRSFGLGRTSTALIPGRI